jgi:hypothetical protein
MLTLAGHVRSMSADSPAAGNGLAHETDRGARMTEAAATCVNMVSNRRRWIPRTGVAGLDRRTSEAQFVIKVEKALASQVGGSPTPLQRALIARAARVALHIALIDQRTLSPGSAGMSITDMDVYARLVAVHTRVLKAIGLQASAPAATLAPSAATMLRRKS